jgi:hypothetical protein
MSGEREDLIPIVPEIPDIDTLLPTPSNCGITAEEGVSLHRFQSALIILGQAAGGALVCPGNQINVPEADKCPYAAKCELLKLQKAPAGDLCPIERELLLARFNGWCKTIGAEPKELREDQRSVVAELTWIDIQEQRCSNILSRGEAARLTQVNVKDSHPESGDWLSWERVIHANAMLLESLHTRKKMIMKEWLLTPEAKFKVAKAMGKLGGGDDLGKKLSSRADKLRELELDTIDAEFTEIPEDK